MPNKDKDILSELIERRGLGGTLKLMAQFCDEKAEQEPTYSTQTTLWDLRRCVLHSIADHAPFLHESELREARERATEPIDMDFYGEGGFDGYDHDN